MARRGRSLFSRRIGRFRWDRTAIGLLLLFAIGVGGHSWLLEHPQHNPWAPLDLRDPVGWATQTKLDALRGDIAQCRAVLQRSEVEFSTLEPEGEGPCSRPDRTQLANFPLAPDTPPFTCPAAIAVLLWERDTLQPTAQEIFGQKVTKIQHLSAYSCRRIYGRSDGPWSEHATANAIDIAGFALSDGTRISVLANWDGDDAKSRFLRQVRDGARNSFATTLSPDYNAAHRDHFHLDMSSRWRSLCR